MTLKVIYSIARAFTLAERAKKLQTQVIMTKDNLTEGFKALTQLQHLDISGCQQARITM